RNHLQEAGVHALGETHVALDQRTQALHRCRIDVGLAELPDGHDRVRVAHGQHRRLDLLARDLQRPQVEVALPARLERTRVKGHAHGLEDGRSHVHAHAAVGLQRGLDEAGERAHADRALAGETAVVHEAHEAACAVAALLDLAAVGIHDAIAEVDVGLVAALDDEDLVRADAEAAIGQVAVLRGREGKGFARGVEHDEVVSGPLHLGKAQLHAAIMATPRLASTRADPPRGWRPGLGAALRTAANFPLARQGVLTPTGTENEAPEFTRASPLL